jgi:Zn-finger nucleic acid-binding protein
MNCPKCDAGMKSYERNGIQVDQCTGCRGIFLDRGELEHLIDAESNFYEPTPSPRTSQPVSSNQYYGKKKKSFLTELLDF